MLTASIIQRRRALSAGMLSVMVDPSIWDSVPGMWYECRRHYLPPAACA
jgi:hypothetical protein